ncbi:hypothetical protein D3C80_2054280 [compost metagenome]
MSVLLYSNVFVILVFAFMFPKTLRPTPVSLIVISSVGVVLIFNSSEKPFWPRTL